MKSRGCEDPKTVLRLPGVPSMGSELQPVRAISFEIVSGAARGIDGEEALSTVLAVWKKRGRETMMERRQGIGIVKGSLRSG